MCLECEANPTFLVTVPMSSTDTFVDAKSKKLHQLILSGESIPAAGTYARTRKPTVQYVAGPAVCYRRQPKVVRRVRSTPAFAIVEAQEAAASSPPKRRTPLPSKKGILKKHSAYSTLLPSIEAIAKAAEEGRARALGMQKSSSGLGERSLDDAADSLLSMSKPEMNPFVSGGGARLSEKARGKQPAAPVEALPDPIEGMSIEVLDGYRVAESNAPIDPIDLPPPSIVVTEVEAIEIEDGVEEEEEEEEVVVIDDLTNCICDPSEEEEAKNAPLRAPAANASWRRPLAQRAQ